MSEDTRKLVIIGSGPAGLTAAIYGARADLRPLVIEGEPSSTSDQPGGQLMITTDVENYPGFPEGVMGPQLMADMRAQAERFGAKIEYGEVSELKVNDDKTKTLTVDGQPVSAKTVLIATGSDYNKLGVPGEQEYYGRGVHYCATCDGAFYRDKRLVVVGGDKLAMASTFSGMTSIPAAEMFRPRS